MENLKNHPVSVDEIFKADKTVKKFLKPSQLIRYESLSKLIGCNLFVKHENQNLTGSFKIRGGLNLLDHISKTDIKGVITFSTGNHGLSISTAAKLYNIPAIVVVPIGSNKVKTDLIKNAGAEVIEAGNNFDEASLKVQEIINENGYYYVHPANEPHLINGVGTEFPEILEELPEIDAIILPIGGGSEVASAVTVFKSLKPEVEIYAVQAEESCAAYKSYYSGKILTSQNKTFAGGFATGTAYETTFNIYRDKLEQFILLSEEEIKNGIALAAFHTHNLVEGAGSATITAALKIREKLAGKNVVLQFSGANASVEEIREAYGLESFETGKYSVS